MKDEEEEEEQNPAPEAKERGRRWGGGVFF
jgi:hypothetical protein